MSHIIARCSAGVFYTGSRGDVFVVRKSKPVENLRKNGLFWSRYSFVTHSIDTDRKPRDWGVAGSAYSIKSFTRHFATGLRSPSGDVPCASEDMACGYWFWITRNSSGRWTLCFYGRAVLTRGGGTPIHYPYGYVPPNGVVILKLLISKGVSISEAFSRTGYKKLSITALSSA